MKICFLDSACFEDDIEDKEEEEGGAKVVGDDGRGEEELF